jgi:hypothetical protein
MFKNLRYIFVVMFFAFGDEVLSKGISDNKYSSPVQSCSNFKKSSISLPIDMEYETKNTALRLGIYKIKYGFPLNLSQENIHGGDVTFFKQFIDNLLANEYKTIFNILDNNKNITQQFVKDRVAFFNTVLSGNNSLKLLSQVCQGNHRIFLLSIDRDGKEKIMSFRFFLNGDDFRYVIEKSLYLDALLRKAYQSSKNHGQLSIAVSDKKIDRAYQVFEGEYFFNVLAEGKQYNSVKINEKSLIPVNGLLNNAVVAYGNIYKLLAEGEKMSFLASLTPRSAQKAKNWLSTLSSDENDHLVNSLMSREIIHAIDANPFVIIFYKDIHYGGVIRHEYLIQNSDSTFGFSLTNFYYENTLDDVFKSQTMFHHNFGL